MEKSYNNNIYLTKKDLNDIENEIETITNDIQKYVFDNTSSPLRNVRVGDNLTAKTLYCSFPVDAYEDIYGNGTTLFSATYSGNPTYVYFDKQNASSAADIYNVRLVSVPNSLIQFLYRCFYYNNENRESIITNIVEFTLPYMIGNVTNIDTNNNIYKYIKIYENENIMPNYVKHTWQDDEFLTMQKIHNIEKGIENIGKYFYKPNGWLECEDWLKTNSIGQKSISYQDLNRWVNNLSLINFDKLSELTIWNSNITQLDWNTSSGIEWEEL